MTTVPEVFVPFYLILLAPHWRLHWGPGYKMGRDRQTQRQHPCPVTLKTERNTLLCRLDVGEEQKSYRDARYYLGTVFRLDLLGESHGGSWEI